MLPLATHLGTPEQARALYVLTALRRADQDRWELERLQQLHDLVQAKLGDSGPSGADARSLITQRLRQAIVAAGADADADVAARIETAPTSFVLRVTPEHLAACATWSRRCPRRRGAGGRARRAAPVGPRDERRRRLVGTRRRPRPTGPPGHGVRGPRRPRLRRPSGRRRHLARWCRRRGFEVRGPILPIADDLEAAVAAAFGQPLESVALPGAHVRIDDSSSPWHTICEVEAADQPGLLHQLATAFTAAGVTVVAASIAERDTGALDTFELVTRDGEKLGIVRSEPSVTTSPGVRC